MAKQKLKNFNIYSIQSHQRIPLQSIALPSPIPPPPSPSPITVAGNGERKHSGDHRPRNHRRDGACLRLHVSRRPPRLHCLQPLLLRRRRHLHPHRRQFGLHGDPYRFHHAETRRSHPQRRRFRRHHNPSHLPPSPPLLLPLQQFPHLLHPLLRFHDLLRHGQLDSDHCRPEI